MSGHWDEGNRLNGMAAQLLTSEEWSAMVSSLRLSDREAQILQRVFDDMKDSVIAMELGISTHTVHTHFERMYRKLGVRDRCGLLVRVFETCLKVRA